jgi:hypothetical protein
MLSTFISGNNIRKNATGGTYGTYVEEVLTRESVHLEALGEDGRVI